MEMACEADFDQLQSREARDGGHSSTPAKRKVGMRQEVCLPRTHTRAGQGPQRFIIENPSAGEEREASRLDTSATAATAQQQRADRRDHQANEYQLDVPAGGGSGINANSAW